MSFNYIAFISLIIVNCFLAATTLKAQEGTAPDIQLKGTARKLLESEKNLKQSPSLENKIRRVSWRLLLGELASDKVNGLPSNSYDLIQQGLTEFNALEQEIQEFPELNKEISSNKQLALRFDLLRVRKDEIEQKKELNRDAELARLSQLREINREYRNILTGILAGQAADVSGNLDQVTSHGKEVAGSLDIIDQIVGKKRDFYLFQDEPDIANQDQEIKLIRELAAPYAQDVRQHHFSMLALTYLRLALRTPQPSTELLETALKYVDLAEAGNAGSLAIPLYVRGRADLEKGLLLTFAAPLMADSHQQAASFFKSAKSSLSAAITALQGNDKLAGILEDAKQQIESLEKPQSFLMAAVKAEAELGLEQGEAKLFRAVAMHHDPVLAQRWIENRWKQSKLQAREAVVEIDTLASELKISGDAKLNLHQGKFLLIDTWNKLTNAEVAEAVNVKDNQTPEELAQIQKLLNSISTTAPKETLLSAKAYLALCEAAMLLTDPKKDTQSALQVIQEIPVLSEELKVVASQSDSYEKHDLLDAAVHARMAEGYLCIRLLPDYNDRAKLAFASAVDIQQQLPVHRRKGLAVGGPLLNSFLNRDDSKGYKQVFEERQLRGSIQRMLPALTLMPAADPEQIAESLSESLLQTQNTGPNWTPEVQFDPQEIIGARQSLLHDARIATTLSLITANKHESAVSEVLKLLLTEQNTIVLAEVDWSKVSEKIKSSSDPLLIYTLASALENYGANALDHTHANRQLLLELSYNAYIRCETLLKEYSSWNKRWPYLAAMTQAGQVRLKSDQHALDLAINFKNSLKLTEAKKTLQDGLKRHPTSIRLQEQLIYVLIDSSRIDNSQRTKILQEASNQATTLLASNQELSADFLLTLAELNQQTGDLAAAEKVYEKIASSSENPQQKIAAQSRLLTIKLKQQQ